ncbi:MAG TPA: class I SAM-dependent methyltransferase [Pyrinomonadaceae bacterium]|jgi:SAM-dependent methyltransferase|nr:class I SAM-dependent methyltransferase [Pyrinomonadaceae bacterium]
MSTDPTRRFSSRVENYIRHRPGYPLPVVGLLADECGLTPASVVADVGSGTGILSEMFLRNGNRVHGVEPNREMREAGERLLAAYENFVSVEGRAEATTLDERSVDFITAGQSLHWFERDGARREFARILRPGGWVVAIWNDWGTERSPFLKDYERLLMDFGTDYCEVSMKCGNDDELIYPFFSPGEVHLKAFGNQQVFDFESLKGRLMSSSYTPEPDHPSFAPMIARLASIFDRHARDGQVAFDYYTKVYYGQLK